MLLIKRAALPRPHEGALELLAEQFVPPWLDCGTSRRIRETEAEATAFVVCHAIGLETGSAASDYVVVVVMLSPVLRDRVNVGFCRCQRNISKRCASPDRPYG